ncbi:aspartyl/asparaginyl beta-hydroxylase domain-containing protein [uncultured Nostoc sp.]|uniref:aspartyl/asparaginyl beta-hydroxylase domain-containing protein n=1 Tax=uncultured Nostoc sp. TaxID=340711 RepID=UPI0035CC754F
MFYETSIFRFTQSLESNWFLIKKEFDRLQNNDSIPWQKEFLYNKGWDIFTLYSFGKKLENNCRLCPETTKLIEAIPGMTTATFSSLAPGTHILPHEGYINTVLRCHLGLIVADDCAIRVGEKTKTWEEGKCLVFDDTVEHEVWNRSNIPRIVLLIDFKKSQFSKLPRI